MRLVALLGLVLLLAGCSEPIPCAPPISAAFAEPIGHEGGTGDADQVIFVRDAFTGQPIPDARVMVLWTRDASSGCSDLECVLNKQANIHGRDKIPLVRLDLATDDDGRAVAHVPGQRAVKTTAWAPGYTEEWSDVKRSFDDTFTLHLFPGTWNMSFEGELAPNPNVSPGPLVGGRPYLATHDYAIEQRVDEADWTYRAARHALALTWDVPLLASVDLDLGWGIQDGAADHTEGEIQLIQGQYTELYDTGTRATDADGRWFELPQQGRVGPVAGIQFVTLEPISYSGTVVMEFEHRRFAVEDCGILLPHAPIEVYEPADAVHNDPVDVEAPAAAIGLIFIALACMAAAKRR